LHLAVNGHLPQKAFHEHAAINHMASDYLQIQFSQSLKYCKSCSEKWWNDPPGIDNKHHRSMQTLFFRIKEPKRRHRIFRICK